MSTNKAPTLLTADRFIRLPRPSYSADKSALLFFFYDERFNTRDFKTAQDRMCEKNFKTWLQCLQAWDANRREKFYSVDTLIKVGNYLVSR